MKKWILLFSLFLTVSVCTAMNVITLGGSGAAGTPGVAGCSGSQIFKWLDPSGTTVDCVADSGDDTANANDTVQITGGAVVTTDTGTDGGDYYDIDVSSFDIIKEATGTIFVRFKITTCTSGGYIWAVFGGTQYFYISINACGGGSAIDMVTKMQAVNPDSILAHNTNLSPNTWYWARMSYQDTSTPYHSSEFYNDTGPGSIGSSITSEIDSTNDTGGFNTDPAAGDFHIGNSPAINAVVEISYIAIYSDYRTTEP